MISDAGGGESRRRRDSVFLCSLVLILSFQLQFPKLSRIFCLLTNLEGKPSFSNRGRLPLPFSTTQLPSSRSRLAQNLPEESSHLAVILEPSDESSTIKMVNFLTQTLENSRFALNDQRSAPNNPLTATVSISDHEILISSRRNHGQPLGLREGKTEPQTLIAQKGPSLRLGFLSSGPLRASRPTSDFGCPIQLTYWPRSVYSIFLAKPNLSMSPYFAENGRRRHFHKVLISLVRLDKYHQKTLEDDTLDREVRTRNCKPVSFIKGSDQPATTTTTTTALPQQPSTIAEDIISLAKTFRTLSFRFISRSEISIADDLSKTASRSMTTGSTTTL